MDTSKLLLRTAAGLVVLTVAACGGGTSGPDTDVTPASTAAAVEQPATDPNEPADVGAIIYEEAVPVPGTTLNACELVTATDVMTALKAETVEPGTLEANPTTLSPGHSECTYEGDFGRIIVALTPEDGANLYDAAYGAYDGLEVIPNLGDGAFWSDKNHRAFVWQDRVATMFTIFANDADVDPVHISTSLGQAMLAKL